MKNQIMFVVLFWKHRDYRNCKYHIIVFVYETLNHHGVQDQNFRIAEGSGPKCMSILKVSLIHLQSSNVEQKLLWEIDLV